MSALQCLSLGAGKEKGDKDKRRGVIKIASYSAAH